jgi:hypothetical protein
MWVAELTAFALALGFASYITPSTAWTTSAFFALIVLCVVLYEFEKRVRRPRA